MVKMVPKYQKYLRVRRGPRRDFTKLYRVSKKYSNRILQTGRQDAHGTGGGPYDHPYQKNRQKQHQH